MRNLFFTRRIGLTVCSGFCCFLATGCGGSSGGYATNADDARQAVEGALSTWRKGAKPDQLASSAPPVHPVDFQWQAGQVLESYRIVGEEPSVGDASKRFSVSLSLANSKGEINTQYVVVGRDPIWVYRDEDYARLLNMDNNPRPPSKRGRR